MTTQTIPNGTAIVENPVTVMRQLFQENLSGKPCGIYSVCSAHALVLDAAFAEFMRRSAGQTDPHWANSYAQLALMAQDAYVRTTNSLRKTVHQRKVTGARARKG